jgi:nitrate/nitrite-specific signal transduction histidine kinase
MHERVQLLDGTLHVDSSPGNGTTIEASFPIKRLPGAKAEPRSATNPQ